MPASPAPKRKVAWSAVVSAAASKTCAAGASTSTVQILRAGVGSACPASLRARARKRCRPGRSPDTLTGDSHALKLPSVEAALERRSVLSGRQRERGGGGGDQTRRPALERRVRRRLDDERPEVDRARPEPVSVTRSEVEPPGARADHALGPPGGRGKIHDGVGKRARALAPLNRIAGRVAAGRPDDDDRPRARCFADPVARRMDIRRILDRHDRRAASSFGSAVPPLPRVSTTPAIPAAPTTTASTTAAATLSPSAPCAAPAPAAAPPDADDPSGRPKVLPDTPSQMESLSATGAGTSASPARIAAGEAVLFFCSRHVSHSSR